MPLKNTYPWNVLVFPAASEIGLEICRALGDSKEVILHGANQPGSSIASFHFKRLHDLPPVHDPECLPQLQRLLAEHKIDAIFPAHDDVVLWLAEHADKLAATVLTSDAAMCQICRSKRATYEALESTVAVPRVWDESTPDMTFPVFVKPDRGQGSQRARAIHTYEALVTTLKAEPDLLVMENLPGREYTVDCFSQNGRVLYAQARRRIQTRNGIASLTQPESFPADREWAEKIASRLKLRGAWFFQIKQDSHGKYRLLEVAPRIAGSMAVTRTLGPNFPLLNLYEAAGVPLNIDSVKDNIMMGRSLDTRFLYTHPIDALYVDLDHTLILRGEVNITLVSLIFQCRNRGIPVKLLTRHKEDVAVTLAQYRLSQIFDEILHLTDDAVAKASFISEKNAVLIDDSFQERSTVARLSGIRCFDAASAICLLDQRK